MKQRIITGCIGGALFVTLVTLGGLWFSVALLVLAAIAYREYVRMANIALFSFTSLLGFIFLGIILSSFFYPIPSKESILSWNNPSVFMSLIYALFILFVLTKNKVQIEKAGSLLLGIFYIGFGFGCFLQARMEYGLELTFFVIILIWATDTGAYLVGRKMGKHKLWPSISPNKTIEGSLGGIIIAILVALLYQLVFDLWSTWLYSASLAILISIIGQVGDLVESALKRHYQVKDSGTLLPGHGGVLDRFDSILFVFPLLYLLQML